MRGQARPVAAQVPRPDGLTLAGFAALIVIGGLNFPVVKATVQDLAPFWSAGIRFATAGVILLGIALARREPLPRGRALTGALLFGLLSFAGAYALAYWGIKELPAGVAAVVMASVPLVTFAAAVLHRLEPFSWQTLGGGVLAIGGIAAMVGGGEGGSLPVVPLAAMLGAAVCIAEAAVVAKRFPPVPPLAMNAIGMTIGAIVLLALSFAIREEHAAPGRATTWIGLAYLVALGSIALFAAYLFVLRRWTASGTSYAFVVFPVVAVAFSALFQGETITGRLLAGAALVISGVYVGALLRIHRRVAEAPSPAPARREEIAAERPEIATVPADWVRCP